jgi:hypothetical protein
MTKHAKTLTLINTARDILQSYNPMTVRQVYYRLVAAQVINNNRSEYQAVSKALATARKDGFIPWEWIEDRLRKPRHVSMWDSMGEFARTAAQAFRLDVWQTQQHYLEVWLEKDALSGIFENVLNPYGVTLNVGRGYDGWSSIHGAARRFMTGINKTILYYGDFDPSGEDMVRSLRDRLAFFGCEPEIIKCALTLDDIQQYNLPPDPTKSTDTRQAAFIKKYGDMAVELDALPPEVLATSIKKAVESLIDLRNLAELRRQENDLRGKLITALDSVRGAA